MIFQVFILKCRKQIVLRGFLEEILVLNKVCKSGGMEHIYHKHQTSSIIITNKYIIHNRTYITIYTDH